MVICDIDDSLPTRTFQTGMIYALNNEVHFGGETILCDIYTDISKVDMGNVILNILMVCIL